MFKKIYTLSFVLGLIIFISSFFIIPKLSFAAMSITTSNLTATGVTLNATGLTPNLDIQFQVFSLNSTPSYFVSHIVTSTANGSANSSFTGLTAGGEYTGGSAYTGDANLGATINFSTPGSAVNPKLTTSSLTATGVTLNATGLTANQNVVFTVASTTGGTGQTPAYNNPSTTTTSPTGTASASFTGLSAGGSYSGSLDAPSLSSLLTVDFTASGAAVGNTAPTIISFGPTEGAAGAQVLLTINGTSLSGATQVVFSGGGVSGISAVPVTSNTTEVTVYVPAGATTGPIYVVTASGESGYSDVSFTVPGTNPTGGNNTTGGNSTTGGNTPTPVASGCSGKVVTFKGLVPVCNVSGSAIDPTTKNYAVSCDFCMVLAIINKVINFLLKVIAFPLCALILLYAGWLYISDMGSAENKTKAKKFLINAVVGFMIALAAWIIVKTILVGLGFDPSNAFLAI